MNRTLRIVQITDCHLAGNPEQLYRGVNPHTSLQTMLKKISIFAPDLLLATGDLSEDASPDSYHELKTCFGSLSIPVLALPGNHDDASLLADTFPGSPVDGVAVTEHGQWQIIRLNSSVKDQPQGRLSTHSLDQLRQLMEQDAGPPRLIALHHQPVAVGSPWIDKYPLLEPESLLGLVDSYRQIKAVVWGHVHQVSDTRRQNVAMLGSPSSTINSIPGVQKFTADVRGPAFRWLELGPTGNVQTGIVYA